MQPDDFSATIITQSPFQFSRTNYLRFLVTYVLAKLLYFWHDVKAPRVRLFVYEVVYSLCRATHRPPLRLRWLQLEQVTTIFGTFNIRPRDRRRCLRVTRLRTPRLESPPKSARRASSGWAHSAFHRCRGGRRDLRNLHCQPLGPPRRNSRPSLRAIPIVVRVAAQERSG